jgi:hypothetical protein
MGLFKKIGKAFKQASNWTGDKIHDGGESITRRLANHVADKTSSKYHVSTDTKQALNSFVHDSAETEQIYQSAGGSMVNLSKQAVVSLATLGAGTIVSGAMAANAAANAAMQAGQMVAGGIGGVGSAVGSAVSGGINAAQGIGAGITAANVAAKAAKVIKSAKTAVKIGGAVSAGIKGMQRGGGSPGAYSQPVGANGMALAGSETGNIVLVLIAAVVFIFIGPLLKKIAR